MISDINDACKKRLPDTIINMLGSTARQMSGAWLIGNILHVIYLYITVAGIMKFEAATVYRYMNDIIIYSYNS